MLHFQAVPGQFGPDAREPGLKVWRVEKMKAVPLEPSEVGAFFNGDSYLVLENRGEEGADLHMWIGEILEKQGGCQCTNCFEGMLDLRLNTLLAKVDYS